MESMLKYFEGEKMQCWAGLVFAVLCLIFSVYFLRMHRPLLTGLAYSFIPLSGLLLIVCVSVLVRTPGDIKRNSDLYTESPIKLQAEELPRMEKVMNTFSTVKKVELAFIAIGILLAIVFWRHELIRGIGFGLIVLGPLLYLFDHLAEARAKVYVEFLKSLGS